MIYNIRKQLFICVTIVIFFSSNDNVYSQCTHPDDIAALVAIYHVLDRANWSLNTINPNTNLHWDPNCVSCDVREWGGPLDEDNDGHVDLLEISPNLGIE